MMPPFGGFLSVGCWACDARPVGVCQPVRTQGRSHRPGRSHRGFATSSDEADGARGQFVNFGIFTGGVAAIPLG